MCNIFSQKFRTILYGQRYLKKVHYFLNKNMSKHWRVKCQGESIFMFLVNILNFSNVGGGARRRPRTRQETQVVKAPTSYIY